MADKPPAPAGDDDRRIADAELLFEDQAAEGPQPKAPPIPEVAPGDDYALEERVETVPKNVEAFFDDPPDARPAGPAATPKASRTREEPETERRERARPEEPATVDQVWTRGAEWGRSLALLAVVAVATGSLFAWLVSSGLYMLALVSGLVGGAVFVLCTYPILISLERPVRITPEQAVKDFYGALSHHIPHFRRTWLLLSSRGRDSVHFSNFPEFKRYWVDRLAALRAGRAGRFTPLKFEVGDFKSEKSQGKSSIDARYTVKVFIRGRQDEGPIESVRVETTLVKGEDRMWYLDKGFLPGERL